MTFLQRALVPAAAAAATAFALTACGTAADATEPAASASEGTADGFNDADVAFAQEMIPHHEQAVEMADLAESRAGDGVRDLAEEIAEAQGPEIERMTGLLESWGESPAPDMEGAGHSDMPGMMSDEEMAELEAAEGEEFDTLFLEMMILHHEGAVTMAETEIAEGVDPQAQDLAEDIFQVQHAEIERMSTMLGESGGADDEDDADQDTDDGDSEDTDEDADDGDSEDHDGH
ncbi:DUF305 domain-containing protein [Nocardiopsis sp. NRRL B-16309]|uniref:DUF305 domain-containing protein n=1 Tax=Nocardiopsis sp. NRRL B-16309 TaxID=1519494 RepID=UPI0006AFC12A|nr:DUF305 domain-containing protein [Nocardiopsis sp. NRRL B-16309]KOX16111.1 hypothetical protein ADL05_12945 [Nocardiopsis sp. NRRL B-16309]